MKVLVLGASGFLGNKIFHRMMYEQGVEVLGTCFQSSSEYNLIKVDITNEEEAKSILGNFRPDIIIWSLISRQSEKHLIEVGVNNILKYLVDDQKFVFMSSNAVFRGDNQNGYFKEEDEPKYKNSNEPLDLYANAKIDGERIVKQYKNYIIIRPGAIYGQDINGKWDKRISDLIDKLKANQEVVKTENLFNSFVKVDELANAIVELIKIDYKGIIHLGPFHKQSYYDYFIDISRMLSLNTNLIKSNKIDKSMDLSLDTSKSKVILGNVFSK
ncbi:NAD-dependent epimerase/dehydratase family protein [Clostridium chromiireducens]|uniref:dTDP-4-dehydrorhamnose reductase n=1 Tax=Clostridium chromiireducens TaxID=225345 RepID=A0A964RL07_9CLOT|nr:sugar nucleotide-binding protein [Clostridium chromiireducens]MVX63500.1 NAD-dependent epimerase/dehydratase family protein [Clostridium chromiireducens]